MDFHNLGRDLVACGCFLVLFGFVAGVGIGILALRMLNK